MTSDLFDHRTAKEKLYDWAVSKRFIKTSEVIRWGSEHFSNRALRNMQDLAAHGKFKRMDEKDKVMAFGNLREDVWLVVE